VNRQHPPASSSQMKQPDYEASIRLRRAHGTGQDAGHHAATGIHGT
jgi:hypothetical protein